MSFTAITWALEDAPVADTVERAILVKLASHADHDGRAAFPSKKTMARVALCDPKTVQRKLAAMVRRGLIALGDQEAARMIPKHLRPTVYDLLIPAAWYGPEQLERVNRDRVYVGLPPLDALDRPGLAPAPERAKRSDAGVPRPRRDAQETGDGVVHRGDSQSPHPGTVSPPTRGLTVPQTSTSNQSSEPVPPSPARRAAGAGSGRAGAGRPASRGDGEAATGATEGLVIHDRPDGAVAAVLEAVPGIVRALTPGQLRLASRAVLGVLQGPFQDPAALAAHLEARLAPMSLTDDCDPRAFIRDPYAWLISQLPDITVCQGGCGRTVHATAGRSGLRCAYCSDGVDPARALAELARENAAVLGDGCPPPDWA